MILIFTVQPLGIGAANTAGYQMLAVKLLICCTIYILKLAKWLDAAKATRLYIPVKGQGYNPNIYSSAFGYWFAAGCWFTYLSNCLCIALRIF